MACSAEMKRLKNGLRKKYGKKNGSICRHLFDHPIYEIQDDKNCKAYRRTRENRRWRREYQAELN